MENTKTTLRQQIEAFKNGKILDYDGADGAETTFYNFFDWFCGEKALKNKADVLFKKVIKFVDVMEFTDEQLDNHYVFFKNNCTGHGVKYDDFRICDIETHNVQFNVCPKTGHKNENPAQVFIAPHWDTPTYNGRTFAEMIKIIKVVINNQKNPI